MNVFVCLYRMCWFALLVRRIPYVLLANACNHVMLVAATDVVVFVYVDLIYTLGNLIIGDGLV